MRFGTISLDEAEGAVLAHTHRVEGGVLRKGTVLRETEIDALRAAGTHQVVAASLEPGDVNEDAAAAAVAHAVAGSHVRTDTADTGRANLFADRPGLLMIDAQTVHDLNAIDPSVTLATLTPFARVSAGQMVGTVKVIPFAVAGSVLRACLGAVARPPLWIAPWRMRRVAAISTLLPSLKPSVVDKTIDILARRLADTRAAVSTDLRVQHEVAPLTDALRSEAAHADAMVVFGASAVVDANDVIPAAIRAAGGRVEHFGMPVDPGNLLVLGEIGSVPVIGAPGCARSVKRNGFDFVLDRLLVGNRVTAEDIRAMGVGGLLVDTPARPRPRAGRSDGRPQRPAALVLAAGRSSRMGTNKLVEDVAGEPMVRHAVRAALESRADPVVVVVGHENDRVSHALAGLDVAVVVNPHYADGLSTSLKAGLSALPDDADAAVVLLGDMPLVTSNDCDRLLGALGGESKLIAMATANGARGNPVAWSRTLFPELKATEGDAGGRALLSRYADHIAEVEIGAAAELDADTPTALQKVRQAATGTA